MDFNIFKDTESPIAIQEEYLSGASLNPFIIYNSSSRGLMMSSHISQALTLHNPDVRIIRTGLEEELGKSAIVHKVENDSEVLAVIPRYSVLDLGEDKRVGYTIIYRDLETDIIDAIVIDPINKYNTDYGFLFIIDRDYIESLTRGDIIPKGKVLAYPSGYDPDTGEYAFGKTLNVAFMSIEGVSEDGVVISESALEKLTTSIFESREIDVGSNSFFLNLYGDEEDFKPFPEIGERVNQESIVMASREYDEFMSPGLYGKDDIKHPNPIFDKVAYVRQPNGIVRDIKVYKTYHRKKMLPKGTDKYLELYSNALINYYKQIIKVYEEYNKGYRMVNNTDMVVGRSFNRLLVEAMNIVESSVKNAKVKKLYRKEPLDLFKVKIDIEQIIVPTIGFKVTDSHGGKGVIVRVWKDEDMPVDKDGNRADIIMDPAATVSRLNVGRLYERYISAASRKAKKYIVDYIKSLTNKRNITGDIVGTLDDSSIQHIWNEYVLPFVKIFDNTQYDIYKEANIEDMRDTIEDIINREFFVYLTVDNRKRAYEIVMDIENSKFKPIYDTVTYVENGKKIRTKNKVFIAPMYIYLLNKLPDGFMATSSAKFNHFGLPITESTANKFRLPHRNNPVRAIGETEGRLYVSYGGRKFLAEMLDRAAAPNTHKEVYKNILTANDPVNIEKVVDRSKVPYGGHKGLEIFTNLINSVGLDIQYYEDTRRYIDPIEHEEDIKNIVDIDNLLEEPEEGE